MTNQDLDNIFTTIKSIPDNNKELARVILTSAADLIALDKLKTLTGEHKPQKKENTYVWFCEKEIRKMPKTFKKEFRTQGCTARVYKRKSGKNTFNYVIRYRRNGYNVFATSNNLEVAKEKFIKALAQAEKRGAKNTVTAPNKFDDFAQYFFATYYKRKVAERTYKNTVNRYNYHVKPAFGNVPLDKIYPKQCQYLIDELTSEGKGKTTDEVFSILNCIFRMAVKHSLIAHNPMDVVFHAKHETKHGKALTKAEEQKLLADTAGTPYQLMFAVALYTGMRPNEYYHAKIVGDFIVTINSKRKTKTVEYKKIPITPMLKPYLIGITELKFFVQNRIREKFHTVFPDKKIYDLRTTFYTRCQECGVADVARNEFVGHSLGTLGDTYTDLSDEFLLKEGEKLSYCYAA